MAEIKPSLILQDARAFFNDNTLPPEKIRVCTVNLTSQEAAGQHYVVVQVEGAQKAIVRIAH